MDCGGAEVVELVEAMVKLLDELGVHAWNHWRRGCCCFLEAPHRH